MMLDEAIKGLRRYAFTPWKEGGPGHSTLTAKIKVVLREIERLRTAFEKQVPAARLGQVMLTVLEGMAAPEIREGADVVDGYICVYEKQRDQIDRFKTEVERLQTELLDTQNAVRLAIVRGRPMREPWPEVSAEDVKSVVAFIRAQREAVEAAGGE